MTSKVKNFYKGKLTRWNDDKGYGIITSEAEQERIFVHISDFMEMRRRPRVGDMVLYGLKTDKDGKTKAINVKIPGLAAFKPEKSKNRSFIDRFVIAIVIVAVGVFAYKKLHHPRTLSNNQTPKEGAIEKRIQSLGLQQDDPLLDASPDLQPELTPSDKSSPNPNYQCDGRTDCSQMTSCEEATFFIKNCPDTEMDVNGDGIPCEKQWCGQ